MHLILPTRSYQAPKYAWFFFHQNPCIYNGSILGSEPSSIQVSWNLFFFFFFLLCGFVILQTIQPTNKHAETCEKIIFLAKATMLRTCSYLLVPSGKSVINVIHHKLLFQSINLQILFREFAVWYCCSSISWCQSIAFFVSMHSCLPPPMIHCAFSCLSLKFGDV